MTDAARARRLAAAFQKEHYVNLIAEPDLSGIAVKTGKAAIISQADALEYIILCQLCSARPSKRSRTTASRSCGRLLAQGYPADGFIFDTALAAYDLDATQGSYDLDRVVTAAAWL